MIVDSIADYTGLEPLAQGAHGRFYLATPPSRLGLDAEHVVVKVIPGVTDETVRRITRELRLFASVGSAYLVRLFDAGQDGDCYFYSMEHLPFGALDAADHVDTEHRVVAVEHAARAGHALHEHGVAHRDIRPGNVLLSDDGGRLADLGLAHLMTGGGSVTSMAPIESVPFSDPALLLGEPPSRATDIYALGTTLHYAASGRSVHPELDAGDPLLAVRTVLRHRPRVDDSLPEPLVSIISACLERDTANRPATASEVADAIADARATTGDPR